MKIKLIDFGAEESRLPYRPHGNDAGADVYMPYGCTLKSGDVEKVPDGYAGYVFPRRSMAAKGLICELPPVDSGNRGENHAIISSVSGRIHTIQEGARVGQLIIMPVVIADFVSGLGEERGTGGFGSTGE